MPTSLPPNVGELLTSARMLSEKLAGREGNAFRENIQRLAQILAAEGSDAELRERAAGELEQLVDAIARLGSLRGPAAKAIRGFNLKQLAGGLRSFVQYLRSPTPENQARAEQLVESLQRSPVLQPVPLEELQVDDRVESLAIQSAMRQGLAGEALARAVERMKRETAAFKRQLEARTQQDGQRTHTATEMAGLLDALIQTGSALGKALGAERPALMDAFSRVDLAHMAAGMQAYSLWIPTSMGVDPATAIAALRSQLTDALGPPTHADALRSEAERRADYDREIQAAVDQIFRGPGVA